MPANTWDDVEYTILTAAREPATARQIADQAGLTPDLAQAQVEVLRDEGLLIQAVAAGVRYHLTLAGWKRLSHLINRRSRLAAA